MTQRLYPAASIEHDSPITRDGEYRSKLLKLLADQARAELEASNIYSRWIAKAPGPEERMHLAEIAKEETEHWYGTIKILEGLGVSPQEANGEWATNHWFYTLVHILIPRYRWEDILMLTFLIDRCAFLLVEDFAQSSYAPWARFARQVLAEEVGHVDFGNNFVRSQVEKLGAKRVQRALDKWWRIALNSVRLSRSTRRNTSSLDLSFAATKTAEKPFGATAKRRFVSWACRSRSCTDEPIRSSRLFPLDCFADRRYRLSTR